jgi:uncharacterized membrane protein YccC
MEPAKEKLDSVLDEIRRSQDGHRGQIEQAFGALHATAHAVSELVKSSHAFLNEVAPLMERMEHLDRRMRDLDAHLASRAHERPSLWSIFGDRQGK